MARAAALQPAARAQRVLLVSEIPFWSSGVGSHVRIRSLCEAIAPHCELTVFSLRQIQPDATWFSEGGRKVGAVSVTDWLDGGSRQSLVFKVPRIAALAKWRNERHARALRAYLAEQPAFDVVIVEYLWNAYLLDALSPGTLTVLDTHDFMALREYRFRQHGAQASVSVTLAEERALLDRFQIVITIQYQEAAALRRLLKKAVVLCCPHGVDAVTTLARPPWHPGCGRDLILGFIGANSVANRSAIAWFLAQVWPLFVAQPVQFNLYGTAGATLKIMPAGVNVGGVVADIAEAYAECDVMLNPMLQGGGLKIKSVEALAQGKPLVTTPEGAAGIQVVPGSGVLLAGSRAAFAEHLLAILAGKHNLAELGRAARRTAEAQFSPSNAYQPLLSLVRDL